MFEITNSVTFDFKGTYIPFKTKHIDHQFCLLTTGLKASLRCLNEYSICFIKPDRSSPLLQNIPLNIYINHFV